MEKQEKGEGNTREKIQRRKNKERNADKPALS